MLWGKIVRLVLRVVLDDATDDHRGKPLAHVPLVQVRRFGDLLAGGGGQPRHGVEEARPVTYTRHDHHRAAVEVVQEPPGEGVGPCLVEVLLYSHVLPFFKLRHGFFFAVSGSWVYWRVSIVFRADSFLLVAPLLRVRPSGSALPFGPAPRGSQYLR
jgi:hypothetical protein